MLQTLIDVRFNWQSDRPAVIRYIDSLHPDRAIARKAVSAVIQWVGLEWEREHGDENVRPLPDKLKVCILATWPFLPLLLV